MTEISTKEVINAMCYISQRKHYGMYMGGCGCSSVYYFGRDEVYRVALIKSRGISLVVTNRTSDV